MNEKIIDLVLSELASAGVNIGLNVQNQVRKNVLAEINKKDEVKVETVKPVLSANKGFNFKDKNTFNS